MTALGKIYGIGVGPGDPELLTRRAARLLGEMAWIYVPIGPSGAPGFAETIIEDLGIDPERLRRVPLAMTRERAMDLAAYAHAAEQMLADARAGQAVAWITEGDPLFYSTFGHVWRELRKRAPEVAVEIVPGVTSIQAAAARAGVPIAQLNERVAVVPAAYGLGHLPELLESFATVFLLKVHGVLGQVVDALAKLPTAPRAFYVEKVGTPDERVVRDLARLRGEKLPYFSLVILCRAAGREDDER